MFSWILEGREREGDMAYEARAHQVQERLIENVATHVHSTRRSSTSSATTAR
jgi:hypothetical protein